VKKSRLLDLFKYDYDTGDFISVARMGSREVGQIAGHPTCKGTVISIDNKQYLAHILAHVWITGRLPTKHIKHKDGNKNNNAKNNLVYKDGSAFEDGSDFEAAKYITTEQKELSTSTPRLLYWDKMVHPDTFKDMSSAHLVELWKALGFKERPLDTETFDQAVERIGRYKSRVVHYL